MDLLFVNKIKELLHVKRNSLDLMRNYLIQLILHIREDSKGYDLGLEIAETIFLAHPDVNFDTLFSYVKNKMDETELRTLFDDNNLDSKYYIFRNGASPEDSLGLSADIKMIENRNYHLYTHMLHCRNDPNGLLVMKSYNYIDIYDIFGNNINHLLFQSISEFLDDEELELFGIRFEIVNFFATDNSNFYIDIFTEESHLCFEVTYRNKKFNVSKILEPDEEMLIKRNNAGISEQTRYIQEKLNEI